MQRSTASIGCTHDTHAEKAAAGQGEGNGEEHRQAVSFSTCIWSAPAAHDSSRGAGAPAIVARGGRRVDAARVQGAAALRLRRHPNPCGRCSATEQCLPTRSIRWKERWRPHRRCDAARCREGCWRSDQTSCVCSLRGCTERREGGRRGGRGGEVQQSERRESKYGQTAKRERHALKWRRRSEDAGRAQRLVCRWRHFSLRAVAPLRAAAAVLSNKCATHHAQSAPAAKVSGTSEAQGGGSHTPVCSPPSP